MGPLAKSTRLEVLALGLLLLLGGLLFHLTESSARIGVWLALTEGVYLSFADADRDAVNEPAEASSSQLQRLSLRISEAREHINVILNGGTLHGRSVTAIGNENLRHQFLKLITKIQHWSTLEQQLQSQSGGVTPRQLFALAAEIASDADTITATLSHEIKRDALLERVLQLVVVALLAVVMLSAFAFMRRSHKATEIKERQYATLLRELETQKRAFDQHSIVAMTDARGVISHANDKFCQISGYSRDELIGKDHRLLNSGYHPEGFFHELWQTIGRGDVWHGEILNRAKDGSLYWVDTTIVPYLDEAGKPVEYVAIRTDITPRKNYEAALKQAELRLQRQNQALRDLAMRRQGDAASVDMLIQFYTEAVAEALNVSRVAVWLYNDERNGLKCADLYNLQKRLHLKARDIRLIDAPAFFGAVEHEGLISITELAELTQLQALYEKQLELISVTALLAAAIRVDGVVVGILLVEQVDRGRSWYLDEENFVTSVGDLLSGLIETINRARVEGALRVIAQTAPASGNIFQELAYQIARGVGADFVSIGQLNDERNRVHTLGVWRENQTIGNFTYVLPQAVAAEDVAREIGEREAPPDRQLQEAAAIGFKARGYLSVPIKNRKQQVIGVIVALGSRAIQNVNLAISMLKLCATRAAAELERNEATERLEAIVDSMSDFIWESNAQGVITDCSERVKSILGYQPEEVIGYPITEFVTGEAVSASGANFMQLLASGKVIRNLELWLKGKSGERVCLMVNAAPIFDADGLLCGYRGISSDITLHKESEIRTRLLATAIDQSVDGVLITDVLGYVEYANPAYLRIVGRSAEEIVGTHVRESGVITTKAEFRELFLEKFHEERQWSGRGINHKRSGKRFDEEVMVTPIQDQQGRVIKVVISVRDITQEMVVEQQSRQSQKMQAIGTMAGGIAHDFNNILSAILGYADLTLEDLPEGSSSHDNLIQVIQAAGRARNLVQQILAFSRQSASSLQLLSPRTMTREVMKLLRATIPSVIQIRENINIDDIFVRMDPTQYHQVVMNLLVNASQAIGEQPGTIEITLDERVVTEQSGDLQPGYYVRLTVTDNGCGMTPEVRERIFEPFFTTKAVDEGTGMGLAAVHGIISAIGGHITVSSTPGKGSRFEVYMPVASERPERSEIEEGAIRQGHERLLIVDDDVVQTALMKQMLERNGYQVTTCNDSSQAVALFRAEPARFDAVITDQMMPGMTGQQLSAELLQIRPDLPVIMCTGYSQRFGPEEAKAAGIREYLMKPAPIRELDRALVRIFDTSAGTATA